MRRLPTSRAANLEDYKVWLARALGPQSRVRDILAFHMKRGIRRLRLEAYMNRQAYLDSWCRCDVQGSTGGLPAATLRCRLAALENLHSCSCLAAPNNYSSAPGTRSQASVRVSAPS